MATADHEEYTKNGVLGILKMWVNAGAPEQPDVIAKMIVQLIQGNYTVQPMK